MTNPLHDAAMAAKRFHDAALAYLDDPSEERLALVERLDTELFLAQAARIKDQQQTNNEGLHLGQYRLDDPLGPRIWPTLHGTIK